MLEQKYSSYLKILFKITIKVVETYTPVPKGNKSPRSERHTESLEKFTNEKQEIDLLMAKFYDGTQTNAEKEQLKKLFISKQQVNNEKVMNEQAKLIESLQAKCKRLRSEIAVNSEGKQNQSQGNELTELKDELADFKSLVYRLNIAAEEKDQKLTIMKVNTTEYMYKAVLWYKFKN